MTEEEFKAAFPNVRLVDENHPDCETIDSPARLAQHLRSGYKREVLEATELDEAQGLAAREELQIKGGIRYRFDEGTRTSVHAYFWKELPVL